VLVADIRDHFYMDCFAEQERHLRDYGYASLLMLTHFETKAALGAIDELIGRGVDGLIVNTDARDPEIVARLNQLAQNGVPIVTHGAWGVEGADYIANEDVETVEALVRHLIDIGHRRIALITRDPNDWRCRGWHDAMQAAGIEPNPAWTVCFDYDFTNVSVPRQLLMSLKDRPTAIMAYNDDLAMALIEELEAHGFKVPDEISVTGVNDGRFSRSLHVPLTTIALPAQEIARASCDILLERLEHPHHAPMRRQFGGTLVLRASTAPPGKSHLD
jgi:DNA-binding LacI/PurR family transcriptional regulator